MQVTIDFFIGVDQNVHRALELIRETTTISRYVYLPKPIVTRVSQMIVNDYIALRLRLKAYVLNTKHEKAFETDITQRVLEAFVEYEIQPPAILYRYARSLGQNKFSRRQLTDQNLLQISFVNQAFLGI
jgi:hypothetical protein